MKIDQNTTTPATECACRKALEGIQYGDTGFNQYGEMYERCPECDHAKERGHAPQCSVGLALATPCEYAGQRSKYPSTGDQLRAELAAAKENYSGAMSDCAEYERQLAAANERAEGLSESRGMLRAELNAIKRQRDTAQAGWKEAVEFAREIAQIHSCAFPPDDGGDECGNEDDCQHCAAAAIVARFDAQVGGK